MAQPTATPTAKPEGSGVMDVVPLGYSFFSVPESVAEGTLLVYVDFETSRINYLTWEGETGPLLWIDLPYEYRGATTPFAVVPVRLDARHVVVDEHENLNGPQAQIFVIFDLLEQEATAFNAACGIDEFSHNYVVGPKYLTYRCSNYDDTIVFVPLDDPAEAFGRPFPSWIPEDFLYAPVWIGSDRLLLIGGDDRRYCLGDVPEWEPICGEAPYDLMAASPDGRRLETREGAFFFDPARVGILRLECLQAGSPSCAPAWTQTDGVINNWQEASTALLQPAAWTPDSAGFVLLDADDIPDPRHPTNPWYLDAASVQLRKLGTIPLANIASPTAHRRLGGIENLALWAPDGEWLLLEERDTMWPSWSPAPIYLMSNDTGELRLLLENAGPIIGELVVP